MKGILFKSDMHKAIREGRKTVTRRVINIDQLGWLKCDEARYCFVHKDNGEHIVIKPRYQIGEVVYIKEATCIECYGKDGIHDACYKTDEDSSESVEIDCDSARWCSPIFMFAWAARDFIQITDVRAERLQEINTNIEDLRAEGIPLICYPNNRTDWTEMAYQFSLCWDSINKKNPWASNPFVWRYQFKPIAPPIRRQEQ